MKITRVRVSPEFGPFGKDNIVCYTDIYPWVMNNVPDYMPVVFSFAVPKGLGESFAKEKFPDAKIEVFEAKCPTCYKAEEV